MGLSRKQIESEDRLEKENRDMDDEVLIATSSTKPKTYHELDEYGEMMCVTPSTVRNGWRKITRKGAIIRHHHPCKNQQCWKNIDGEE